MDRKSQNNKEDKRVENNIKRIVNTGKLAIYLGWFKIIVAVPYYFVVRDSQFQYFVPYEITDVVWNMFLGFCLVFIGKKIADINKYTKRYLWIIIVILVTNLIAALIGAGRPSALVGFVLIYAISSVFSFKYLSSKNLVPGQKPSNKSNKFNGFFAKLKRWQMLLIFVCLVLLFILGFFAILR